MSQTRKGLLVLQSVVLSFERPEISARFLKTTLVARQRKYFRGFPTVFLIADLPPKKVCQYTRIYSLLVNSVTATSHANRDTSLIIVIFMLQVFTYIVSHEKFWNWIDVVRFVSRDLTKGLLIDTCFTTVCYKWCCCNHWYWSSIIYTTNELIERIRNLKSNAPQKD